ncbi:MAG: hypothetical protein KF744_12645 [Taibaiella sp.]|nr:hypothetical protein [Taibaiella sp.]
MITLRVFSNGRLQRNAMKMRLVSNVKDTIIIKTETGLMYKAPDDGHQPLVTLGGDLIPLNPCEVKDTAVTAFCGNANAQCPVVDAEYTFVRQLDTSLVTTLQYVRRNNLPLVLAQHLVWMYTNNFGIETLYAESAPVESENFAKYVAGKLKLPPPKQYVNYRIDTSGVGPVVRRKEEKAFVNLRWTQAQVFRNVHVSVYRSDGSLYKRLDGGIVTDRDGSAVVVEFYSKRDPAGIYRVRLHDDANNTIDEKLVTIGG